jgi:hypothetical protein
MSGARSAALLFMPLIRFAFVARGFFANSAARRAIVKDPVIAADRGSQICQAEGKSFAPSFSTSKNHGSLGKI